MRVMYICLVELYKLTPLVMADLGRLLLWTRVHCSSILKFWSHFNSENTLVFKPFIYKATEKNTQIHRQNVHIACFKLLTIQDFHFSLTNEVQQNRFLLVNKTKNNRPVFRRRILKSTYNSLNFIKLFLIILNGTCIYYDVFY